LLKPRQKPLTTFNSFSLFLPERLSQFDIDEVFKTDTQKVAERPVLEESLIMTLPGPVPDSVELTGLMKF